MKIVPEKPAARETRKVDPATTIAANAFPPAPPPAAAPLTPAVPPAPPQPEPAEEAAALGATSTSAPVAPAPGSDATPAAAPPASGAPTAASAPERPAMQLAPVAANPANIVRVGEKQKTENRTVLYPDSAAKARLRHIRDTYKIAEAFVGEDALAYYLEAFSDEDIVARLRRANRAGLRRPVSFVEIPS